MSNDRNRDVSEAYSSSGSAQSNFSASAVQQQSRQSYAPGTGAAFMAQSGWTNRDEYGRPRQSSTTVFPVFTPAPRPPLQLQRRPFGSNNGVQRGESNMGRQPHEVIFSEAPNYKKVYLIALIIVTVLLISLIALIVILLATKVFIYNVAQPPPSTVSPTTTSTVQIPVVFPAPFSPPQLPSPQPPPHLVTRTFECEFFILDQANQAYDNANSFEQYQAQTIIQNALVTTFEGSSLRDMNPTIGLEKLENSGSDLRIIFRLSIVVLEQNPGLRELTIKNLLLSEAGTLEGLLNRTSLDRNRVSVKPISKK